MAGLYLRTAVLSVAITPYQIIAKEKKEGISRPIGLFQPPSIVNQNLSSSRRRKKDIIKKDTLFHRRIFKYYATTKRVSPIGELLVGCDDRLLRTILN
jgi:hypothetical protein